MLSKIFNISCTVIAAVSIVVFCVYPSKLTNDSTEWLLPKEVYLALYVIILIVLLSFLLIGHGTVEGFDKDKGIDEDVTVFMKRGNDARQSNEVVVTMLSEQSNREIKNLLKKIENLEKKKEGVVAKLIISLIFAVMCVTLYLTLSTDIPRGPLAITIAFVSTFSIWHFFMRMQIDAALDSKSKAIGKVALKHQRISDDKGSTKTIKPYIFNRGLHEIEGYPMEPLTFAWDFYLLLDNLRTMGKKSEVDKILKEFVLLENSDIPRVEKAEAKFKLMGKLHKLDKKTLRNSLYQERITERRQIARAWGY